MDHGAGNDLLKNVLSAVQKFLCKVHGTQADHNYSPMLHVLYHGAEAVEQINTMCVQEATNLLWTLLEELKDIADSSDSLPRKMEHWMDQRRPTRDVSVQTDSHHAMNDAKFVQITCDNNEFNRRIESFMKRKRAESDAFNRREFCTVVTKPDEASCARTNAIYVPRQTRNSLLQIEHVRNTAKRVEKSDPGMEGMKMWPPAHPASTTQFSKLPSDLKERISNLNSVLFPSKGDRTEHTDIYSKIKDLESRVLYLESVSPEYFQDRDKEVLMDDGGEGLTLSHGEMIQQQHQQHSHLSSPPVTNCTR